MTASGLAARKLELFGQLDIRDAEGVGRLFERLGSALKVIVHTAAQPSHDWAARDPQTDFGVNALGTLNLLEATRRRLAAYGEKLAAGDVIITGSITPPIMLEPDDEELVHTLDPIGEVSVSFARN